MKKSIYIFILAAILQIINNELYAGEIMHVRIADKNVIVVSIGTLPGEESPSQDPDLWFINGNHPTEVGRYTYVWYQEPTVTQMSHYHKIYLKLESNLETGTNYSIQTPGYGNKTLQFNDKQTICESIHTNQVGYFGGSRSRYANFGIFMGDLGSRLLEGNQTYSVIDENENIILNGSLDYWGDDTNLEFETGEYIYRIDLSDLPAGGPYTISVDGFGCSFPFGVGSEYMNQISFINMRGMFHQRCGIALEEPYTEFTRGICHPIVEITDSEVPESGDGLITERGPEMNISGGYHDAADYDHRDSHMLIPSWMLAIYEGFPEGFTDNQYHLPESGNGIPDWLDECLWGLKVWEYLQESDGAIRGGKETSGYPPYGGSADEDVLIYKTYKRYGVTTARGVGLFAFASRMLRPYDSERADELLQRALDAWNFLQNNPDDPDMETAYRAPRMYGALQLYLATEDQTYHDQFKSYARLLLSDPTSEELYRGGSLGYRSTIFGPYFFSYLITDLPVEQDIVEGFTEVLSEKSDKWLDRLASLPYPIVTIPNYGWGRASAQGMFAEPLIYMFRLTGDSTYLDGVGEMANYSLGQNPLNRSYITGLGFNPPTCTRNHDTYNPFKEGKGTIPGITVYGPVYEPASSRSRVSKEVYPTWYDLGQQRRYSDGWEFLRANEYTVNETISQNNCMFGFLSSIGGGGLAVRPDAPVNLAATAISENEIEISWEYESNNALYFRIERKEGENFIFMATAGPDERSYNDKGLSSASTEYTYHISAYNQGGFSRYSDQASAITLQVSSPPEAPLNLEATEVTATSVTLSWKDNSYIEEGFSLERKDGENNNYTEIASIEKNQTEYTDTDLTGSETYYYRLLAFNSAGNSDYSNEIEVNPANGLASYPDSKFSCSIYPNPLNQNSTIDVFAPFSGTVKIEIFDLSGRILIKLYEGNLTAGSSQFPLYNEGGKSINSGSGILFCRITAQAGNKQFSQIMKLVSFN